MKPVCCGVFVLGLLGGSIAFGQEPSSSEVSPQLWIDYNPIKTFSKESELFGDIGLRTELESAGWGRIVVRPGYRYRPNAHTFLTVGIGSFLTVNELLANEWEIRPFQGAAATWPRTFVRFQHYGRLEERFVFNTRDWNADASVRLRYRLRFFRRLAAPKSDDYWMPFGSGELFFNLLGNQSVQFREQFRFSLGVERSFGRAYRVRANVTWQLRDLNIFGEVNDIYVRLRFYHAWGA